MYENQKTQATLDIYQDFHGTELRLNDYEKLFSQNYPWLHFMCTIISELLLSTIYITSSCSLFSWENIKILFNQI